MVAAFRRFPGGEDRAFGGLGQRQIAIAASPPGGAIAITS
jgi:hypothetical protein